MKMRIKLFLSLWAFGSIIFLVSNLGISGLSLHSDDNKTKLFAAYGLAMCIIAGISYLISITYCRRLELLAEQAQEVSVHRSLAQVELSRSEDELQALAKSINMLKNEQRQGEELRSRLVADVAHELRTPIAILRGHLETILEGAMAFDRDHLVPLLDETKRMSRLIQDMQDLNLAEAGKLNLEREWVPFALTLEEIVSILEMEADAKSIALQLDGDGDGEIYCDVPRIKQVLINLIGNAIRYTPEGGRVSIHFSYKDGQIVIAVADNGPGIAPENLPYLFKRFYRVEGSRNRMSGGTGLGLAIAKQFVELHGGTLHVVSELGAGTTFTVTLPVYPSNP